MPLPQSFFKLELRGKLAFVLLEGGGVELTLWRTLRRELGSMSREELAPEPLGGSSSSAILLRMPPRGGMLR